MENYIDNFLENEITVEVLDELTEADLKELKDKFGIKDKEDHCFFKLDFESKKLAIKKNISSLYDSSFVKLLENRLVEMKK